MLTTPALVSDQTIDLLFTSLIYVNRRGVIQITNNEYGGLRMRNRKPYLVTALAAMACTLVLPAEVATGQVKGSPPVHERLVEDFIEESFCGTGEAVSVHFESHSTVSESEGTFKVLFNDKASITYNNVTLIEQAAGRTVEITAPPQNGAAQTIEVVENGLRGKLKLANGRVLTSDHGLLNYFVSFDADGEFLGVDVVRDSGGHPAFLSDVFCGAATEAFGIPFPG
ncbi:MAG TPA: hypothetical protein VIT20_07030 [Propionibacteriaceae bacterium]